jgi:threonine dehydrogenase-like Zn-dependent dehydrogenase
LPDTADLVAATLLRPASVAAEAFEAASLKPGERVVVLGAGVVGLLLVQLLAAASPLELVVVDPDPGLGALALASGATGHCASVDSARVMGVFDLVVETTGTAASPHSACLLAAREARIVFTRTFPPGTRPLDLVQLSLRQLTLLTASVASSKAWSTAVRAFGEGILDPRRLIDDARLPGSRGDALVTVLRGL